MWAAQGICWTKLIQPSRPSSSCSTAAVRGLPPRGLPPRAARFAHSLCTAMRTAPPCYRPLCHGPLCHHCVPRRAHHRATGRRVMGRVITITVPCRPLIITCALQAAHHCVMQAVSPLCQCWPLIITVHACRPQRRGVLLLHAERPAGAGWSRLTAAVQNATAAVC